MSHLRENVFQTIRNLSFRAPREKSERVEIAKIADFSLRYAPFEMTKRKFLKFSDNPVWEIIIAIILFLSYFIFLKNYSLMFQYSVLALFAFTVLQILGEIKKRSFKRPKLTLKVMFIYFLLSFVYSLIAFCWISSFYMTKEAKLPIGSLASGSALMLFAIIINPLIISSIVLAIEPIFYFQKKRIIKRAAEKMRGLKKVKVIGITGSYGKTSTKEFLYTILSQKYKVVKTEGNNNTNIGVAYTVLNKVSDEYDYFICEMGAYKIGEIKEMCEIVKPGIGILTGINNQHIDLFGSQENIIKGKFELIEALPEEGLAVLNEKLKTKIEERKFKVKNLKYFSLGDANNIKVYQDYVEFEHLINKSCHPELVSGSIGDLSLTNVNSSKSESNRIGKYGGDNQKILKQVQNDRNSSKFRLNILGKHYIENVLSGIMAAEHLGMSLDEIKSAVEKIRPNELMMRKLEGPNNSIFIDDSYSANTDGVLAALDYLNETYSNYKKIIVFPGIIELGKYSEEAHKMLYNRINKVCDVAYILETGNWKLETGNKCKFVFEKDFDRVAKMVRKDLNKNTVVLFESRGAGAVMGKLKKQLRYKIQ